MAPLPRIDQALCHGYERLAAWADLLDRINVFPVADADTGTNLKISLAPLRQPASSIVQQRENLLRAATGNSGNIACAFLGELIGTRQPDELAQRIPNARDRARRAVIDPQPGTMLTLFDTLADSIDGSGWPADQRQWTAMTRQLETAVAATTAMLPDLAQAGVVDAGAWACSFFSKAFWHSFSRHPTPCAR
ncbi:DAK2 domain-containing protein [Desulfosarcina cetonica]|uniref:DAK2 domain-containing protein n=1 Tax=Desulfosarcina cetonica TaxID=90730 RepID=UPI0006D12759|nr:DAK2 domain-containing protein [Desulfosarcina cetonica]